MKLAFPSTLVIVAALAVAGLAQTCPSPAATPAQTWKHGAAEYNDFVAITKETDRAQQAQLAAAFAQKYPDSNYKGAALEIETQDQTSTAPAQAIETAESLIKSGIADAAQLLAADSIISYVDPNLIQPNDPQVKAKSAALLEAATCGLQLLSSAPAAQQAALGPVLTKAQGFAQLNAGDYDAAIATLTKAAQQKPTDPLPYYWMGVADVTKTTPDYNNGLFDLAKAAALAPTAQSIQSYLNTVYTTYHGSTDGLQDLINTAKANSTPPAGFKIQSKVDVENAQNMAQYQAQVEAAKNALPPADSFAGIEARLKKSDLAADEWKAVKGQGYELDGLVTAVGAGGKSVDIAVGATTPGTPADVHLDLAQPLTAKKPKVGENVTFDGVALSFKPNPPDANAQFVLTMNQGSVKGYTPAPHKQ